MATYLSVEHRQEGEYTSTPDGSRERTHVSEHRSGCPLKIDRDILRAHGDTMTKEEYEAWHLEEYGR